MDQRYLRLRYYLKLSNKLSAALAYYESWHRWGCYRQRREDKYKNIDRTTIRKPRE
jgi:hypothetical protein